MLLSERLVPPLRRLTFGSRPKSKQKVLPHASGPPAAGSLTPSLLRGHATTGHPWPNEALTTSCCSTHCATIPLGLLKGAFVRARMYGFGRIANGLWLCRMGGAGLFKNRPNDSVQIPPSGGRVQVLRRGAFGRMPSEACWAMDGPSCRPSEQHRNEGS